MRGWCSWRIVPLLGRVRRVSARFILLALEMNSTHTLISMRKTRWSLHCSSFSSAYRTASATSQHIVLALRPTSLRNSPLSSILSTPEAPTMAAAAQSCRPLLEAGSYACFVVCIQADAHVSAIPPCPALDPAAAAISSAASACVSTMVPACSVR